MFAIFANLRRQHAHTVSNNLLNRYGKIAVERLNVRGMVGNRRLVRAISDAGWNQFVAILKSKAGRAGVEVVEVNPRGTSQECSGCGVIVQKALSERTHKCDCGLVLQRDVNAARNILRRAFAEPGTGSLNVIPAIAGLFKEATCFSW